MRKSMTLLLGGICFIQTAIAEANIDPSFSVWGERTNPICGEVKIPEGWTEYRKPVWNAPVTPGKADADSGYLLWAPHFMDSLSPYQTPDSMQLNPYIRISAAPDECEPIVLALRPNEKLDAVELKATPLTDADGKTIHADRIDIRYARELAIKYPGAEKTYIWRPELLEHFKALSLQKGRTAYFWLTLHVPVDCPAGIYRGEIRVSAAGKPVRTVPVQLQVWPFRLEEPQMELGMYIGGHISDYEMRLKLYQDMKAHGMNTTAPCNFSFPMSWKNGEAEPNFAMMDREVKLYKAVGFSRPLSLDMRPVESFLTSVQDLRASLERQGKTLPLDCAIPFLGMNVAPKFSDFEAEQVQKIVAKVKAHAEANQWPELYWLPQEESTNAAAKLLQLEQYSRLYHENGVKVTSWSNGPWGGVDELQPLDEYVDVRYYNSVTPELADRTRKSGDLFAIYNHGDRAQFGFFAERIGAQGAFQWAYMFMGVKNAFCNGTLDYINSVAYPGDTGPIPSPMWERIREGVDDQKYIATFKKLLAEAEGSADEKRRQTAKEAAAEFQQMVSALPNRTAELYRWLDQTDPEFFDLLRRRTVRLILKLMNTAELSFQTVSAQSTLMAEGILVPSPVEKTSSKQSIFTPARIVIPFLSKPADAWPLPENAWESAVTAGKFLERYSDAWKKAQAFAATAIGDIPGVPAAEQTTLKLMYDRNHLYVKAVMHESRMDKLIAKVTQRNGAVYSDDSFEIFFVTEPTGNASKQLAVNALGTLSTLAWDLKGTDRQRDGEWMPEIGVKPLKGSDFWQVELKIPFTAFGLAEAPASGSSWKVNFGREQQRLPEFSTWSQISSSFHELQNYGTMYFGSEPAFQMKKIGDEPLYQGPNRLELELTPRRQESFQGTLTVQVKAPSGDLPPVSVPISVPAEGGRVTADYPITEPGDHQVIVSVRSNQAGMAEQQMRFTGTVVRPLILRLMQKELEAGSSRLRARFFLNRSLQALAGCRLEVRLNGKPQEIMGIDKFTSGEQELRLPAASLPAGVHRIELRLFDPKGAVIAEAGESFRVIE